MGAVSRVASSAQPVANLREQAIRSDQGLEGLPPRQSGGRAKGREGKMGEEGSVR